MSSTSVHRTQDLHADLLSRSTLSRSAMSCAAAFLLWTAAFSAGCSMRSLIYPAPDVWVGAPPAGFEEVALLLDDGTQVIGWHRPRSQPGDRPVMVFFHGNGENLETMKWSGLYEQLVALRVPLLVVDYPGYGRSTGQPSEQSLKRAATAAKQWARERYPKSGLVPCGWSLGAALALYLAATGPSDIDGVVAISPWTRLSDVANAHFPRVLVSLGLREEYDSLALAQSIDRPALVLHGTADRIIPVDQGELVAMGLKTARWIPVEGAGHNDLLSFSEVWLEIEDFVSGLRAAEGV